MGIIWDGLKNEWLMLNRNISFEEISTKILNKEYLDIIKNPAREEQKCFIMSIDGYIWAIPFILDDNLNIVLKTAFPSRKLQKKYGEQDDK
jgi:uncharacterized DUF497 family protein